MQDPPKTKERALLKKKEEDLPETADSIVELRASGTYPSSLSEDHSLIKANEYINIIIIIDKIKYFLLYLEIGAYV